MAWGQVVQVIVDRQDRVFFFHRERPGVLLFDTAGNYQGSWDAARDTFPDIHSAYYGTDAEGEYLILVDRNSNEVARTTLDGEVVWTTGSRPDLFDRPTDAAVASNGDIYVSDGYGNAKVHRLSARGEHLGAWGEPGSGPGQFNLPHGVWLAERDGQECVYICDRENRRIQIFSLNGAYLAEIGDLARPTDIVVGPDGTRYISELLHRVTLLDAQDRVVAHLGGESSAEPGQFVAPHAVWLDSAGALYVTEVLEGRRVQKFDRR
jgi:DNA-binding beta-propeller fold protein YncE